MAKYPVDFSKLDILDIAIKLQLKLHPIQGGRQYETHCWRCDDKSKNGKIAIHPAKGVFRCNKCGYSGNVYTMAVDLLGSKERALEFLKGEELTYNPQIRRQRKQVKEEVLAPIEIRNAVYTKFLKKLVLYSRHRENLRNRGLSDDVIDAKCYKSTLHWDSTQGVCRLLAKEGYPLKGVPGFYKKDGKWIFMTLPGFLIPVRDMQGRIQGIQIRVDETVLKQKPGLRKYIWKSSAGKPNGVSSGAPVHIATPNKPMQGNIVYITEGPLKADIASMFLEVPFIGIAGVGLYRLAVEAAESMGAKITPILFDMDKLTNEHVKKAEKNLITELTKKNIKAFPIEWNPKIGKGIDDVLVTHNEQFKEFIMEYINKQVPVQSKIRHWMSRMKKVV